MPHFKKANRTSFKKGQSGNPNGKPPITIADLPEGWKEKMLAAATDGAGMAELRVISGLRNNTFYNLQERDAEFAEVVEDCRDLMEVWWERAGKKMVTGEVNGNATVWAKNMLNKFNWHDKTDINIRTPDGIQVQTRHTLDDFYAKSGD